MKRLSILIHTAQASFLQICTMIASIISTDLSNKLQSSVTKSNATLQSVAPQQSRPSKLPPNAKIIGNYLLGKNIGQGTFGKVHLAMHIPTGEKVAIKLIEKKNMRPKDVIRVKNEINVLSCIRHRNILQLYEIIQTEKSLLLVTEYLEKGELFRKIIKDKKLAQEQACIYFHQIIDAVQYLHNNRIAHRDLKPENMLIDFDNQLKIIDFGLSTTYSKNKELKSYCGSPCYAAPEIIEGKNTYNPVLTDLWSCGVILFAMICGYLPFCDPDTHTLYKKILACNYKFPSHISAGARDLIENLLVQNPSKRMKISDIRSHEWFNAVSTPHSYGINRGSCLRIDYSLVEKAKDIKVNSDKLIEGLSSSTLNKDTASYFILMKKLFKDNQKMPAYIGSDSFDPQYIQHFEEKGQDYEPQTPSDPMTVVQSTNAPEMMDQSHQQIKAGSSPDLWNLASTREEQKEVSQQELFKGLEGIYGIFSGLQQQKTSVINQILAPTVRKEVGIKRIISEKKQAQFYAFNKNNEKAVDNLQQYKTLLLHLVESKKDERLSATIPKKPSYDKHSFKSRSIYDNEQRSSYFKDKKVRDSKKIEKLIDSAQRKEDVEKVLPYLNYFQNLKLKEKISQIRSKPFRTVANPAHQQQNK